MKRKWISAATATWILAVAMGGGLSPAHLAAEELLETEARSVEMEDRTGQDRREQWTDGEADDLEGGEDHLQNGNVAGGDFDTTGDMQRQSDQTGASPDVSSSEASVPELQILSVEETADPTALSSEAVTETLEGGTARLYESGRSEYAGTSDIAPYANGVFHSSYGEQLEKNAAAIYQQMEQSLVKNCSAAFTCTLPSPLTFPVYPAEDVSGKVNWRLESNEQYHNAIVNAVNAAAQSAYDAFTYDHPEVFWLGSMSYEWKITFRREAGADNGTGTIREITFTPKEEYTGAAAEIAAFSDAVQKAVATVRTSEGTAREEQLRRIHDYVCAQLTYEQGSGENARAWSAGGAFLHDHRVVCEGYAKMFKILCDQFQIPCVLVPGLAMTQDGGWESHMWNEVQMEDGLWYLVDTTWDDQEQGPEEVYFLCGSGDYGMLSSVTVGEERVIYPNFSSAPTAQSFTVPELAGSRYHSGTAVHVHTWKEISREEPGCETEGRVVYQCTSCAGKKQEALAALGHQFTTYRSNQDATCTKDGTKTAICDRCKKAKDTLPDVGSGGHRYVYTSNKDATVFQDGTKTGRCTRCGNEQTVTEKGSRLSPTMKWNLPSVLHMKKGQTTGKGKIWGLAKGDAVKSWKSSQPRIVAVQKQTGKLTAKKIGKARITVTLKSGYSRSFVVQVQKGTVKTGKIITSETKLTMMSGKRKKLSVEVEPFTSRQKLTYRSSNKKAATVSATGVITAKRPGRTVITIQSGTCKKRVAVTVKAAKK